MTPYHHGDKAGNRGDVWKHFILGEVAQALLDRYAMADRPFHFLETHAGPGRYPLAPGGAWEEGVGRLGEPPTALARHPCCLHPPILDDGEYAGSWLQVYRQASRAGRSTRLSLCEREPDSYRHPQRPIDDNGFPGWECHWHPPAAGQLWGCGMLATHLPATAADGLSRHLPVLATALAGTLQTRGQP